MFRLDISNKTLTATFSCPFCGAKPPWPLSARILWKGTKEQQPFPDVRHVILTHWFGNELMEKFGFPKCTQQKWESTTYESMDADDKALLSKGTVTVKDGYPDVSFPVTG